MHVKMALEVLVDGNLAKLNRVHDILGVGRGAELEDGSHALGGQDNLERFVHAAFDFDENGQVDAPQPRGAQSELDVHRLVRTNVVRGLEARVLGQALALVILLNHGELGRQGRVVDHLQGGLVGVAKEAVPKVKDLRVELDLRDDAFGEDADVLDAVAGVLGFDHDGGVVLLDGR